MIDATTINSRFGVPSMSAHLHTAVAPGLDGWVDDDLAMVKPGTGDMGSDAEVERDLAARGLDLIGRRP